MEVEEQLKENQQKRVEHERQMSNVSKGRTIEKERVRDEIKKLRSLHHRKIQVNKEAEF